VSRVTNARRSPNRALTAAIAAGALLLSAGAASAAPDAPTLTGGPGVGSNSIYSTTTSPTFTWTGGAGGLDTFAWAVDDDPDEDDAAATTTVTLTGVDQGPRVFNVAEAGDVSLGEDPIGPSASVNFFVDSAPPSFGRSISNGGTPTGSNGWFNTSATVDYSCSDPNGASGSGLAAPCPADITSDGVFTLVGGPILDNAGNASVASFPGGTFRRDTVAPDPPTLGTVGPVTNEVRPTFTWSEVPDALPSGVNQVSGLAGYRIRISQGATVVYETPATALIPPGSGSEASFPGSSLPADLVNGLSYTWRVQAIDNAGNVRAVTAPAFTIDTSAPNAPVIGSGPVNGGATNDSTPTFTWTGLPDATFRWRLRDAEGTVIVPPAATFAAVTTFTPPAPLTDGVYTFEVQQRAVSGAVGGYGDALFTVDTVVPGAPSVNSSPGTTSNVQPSFGWAAAEQGGMFVWEVTGVGGVRVLGPGETATASTQLSAPLTQGTYVFRVRHRDRASNLGEWSAPEPFTIVAAPPVVTPAAPTAPTTPVSRFRPSTRNAKALTPRVGTKVRPTAATLRWKRARGATLYNIQIFRIDGTTYRKVHSAFPRGLRYRVPSRVLKPGKRYVWRVWPYVGRTRSYTRNPLGISWFDTPTAARR